MISGNSVLVNESFLDELLLEAALQPDPGKLTFTPDKNIGEGPPKDMELEYRQKLLNELKMVYKEFQTILKSKGTDEELIKQLDVLIDRMIKESQRLALEYVTDCYYNGIDVANQRLRRVKVSEKKVTDKTSLVVLITQQQDNLEDTSLVLRGRLRQLIRMRGVMGNYAQT